MIGCHPVLHQCVCIMHFFDENVLFYGNVHIKEVIFDGKNVLIVLRTYKGADATKELKENSLVNQRKRGGRMNMGKVLQYAGIA